jgi:hypothetical protein
MRRLNLRNIKIIDELMTYCYSYGASDITVNINTEGDETTITLSAIIDNLDLVTIQNAEKLLNAPRCREMEEYYWELNGDDDTDTELTLVGIMTDEAYINYYDSKRLQIILKRRV